ncbi:unnamed protein product [Caenorhabditis bovis]|uniref:Uncharacterized protein n=1 Tax=Caenorhabditis bovis TaxID=2654633 RepID=A0A8S1EL36_9PELO|nr:unnamed protein product [Caenorhabditis bovis]
MDWRPSETIRCQVLTLLAVLKELGSEGIVNEATKTLYRRINYEVETVLNSEIYDTIINNMLTSKNIGYSMNAIQWMHTIVFHPFKKSAKCEEKLVRLYCAVVDRLDAQFSNVDLDNLLKCDYDFFSNCVIFLTRFLRKYGRFVENADVSKEVAESHQKALRILVRTLKIENDLLFLTSIEFWLRRIIKMCWMGRKSSWHQTLGHLWKIYESHFTEILEYIYDSIKPGEERNELKFKGVFGQFKMFVITVMQFLPYLEELIIEIAQMRNDNDETTSSTGTPINNANEDHEKRVETEKNDEAPPPAPAEEAAGDEENATRAIGTTKRLSSTERNGAAKRMKMEPADDEPQIDTVESDQPETEDMEVRSLDNGTTFVFGADRTLKTIRVVNMEKRNPTEDDETTSTKEEKKKTRGKKIEHEVPFALNEDCQIINFVVKQYLEYSKSQANHNEFNPFEISFWKCYSVLGVPRRGEAQFINRLKFILNDLKAYKLSGQKLEILQKIMD